MRRLAAAAAVTISVAVAARAGAEPRWWKGCVHAHANWGAPQLPTTSPDTVVRWYREHGYAFVALTDLNYLTPVAGLAAVFDAPGRFLVVPGIEPSREHVAPGDKIVDTIGIGIGVTGAVAAPGAGTVAAVLDDEARAIRRAGGLPIAAHPNLTWAVTADDLVASDRTAGPRFFEVWNAEPGMNNAGGGGRPSTEQIWDAALSTGRVVYATAVDDAHHFDELGVSRVADRPLANPGQAWIVVRAAELSTRALLDAMARGDFYATTGVTLLSYDVDRASIRIGLDDRATDLGWSAPGTNPQRYRTEFVGKGGRVLATDESLHPSYRFDGSELYVRARITSSDGHVAWTQPVFRR